MNEEKDDDQHEIELKDVTDEHHGEKVDLHKEFPKEKRRGSHSLPRSDEEDTHREMVVKHKDGKKAAEEKEGEDAGSDSDDESEDKPWDEKSGKEKFYWILNLPLVWTRKLTIPPADKKDFDNYYVLAWPWLGIPVNVCLVL